MRLTACLLALCLALAVAARPNVHGEAERLLRASLREGRRLAQAPSSAVSQAQGQTASAVAVAGPGVAQTQQAATGPGATVSGVSQVGQRVDACQRGPADSAACQTLTTQDRSITCTDIAPPAVPGATFYNCTEQARFGKCDSPFIYLGSFCLASCGRCGSSICTDVAPSPQITCALGLCNTTEVIAGPYCLHTCGRCSGAPLPPGYPVAAQASAQAQAQASSGGGGSAKAQGDAAAKADGSKP